MTDRKKDKPLSLDIPFDEAFERFIGTDHKELKDVKEDDDDIPTETEIELP